MKKIIMIVDDEPPIIKVVADVLEPEGYKVISALDGNEALKKLKKVKPDLILIDFFLPGMSGLELCREIREDKELKNLKIAFLTAASFTEIGDVEMKNLNILTEIKKPFKYKDLIEKVGEIVG